MNGNWYSWSTGSTPSDYVMGWHRVYDMLASKGLDSTRLQWIWSVNAPDVGQYTAEEYWVGDNYTDWLGIDGYNWGSSQSWSHWQWPNEVFDNMVGRLRKLSPTKPMSFNEFGTVGVRVGNTTDIASKNEWLRQVCDYINNNNIKMPSYFNVDEPHQDIMIFGGTYGDETWHNFKAYSAYRDCLQDDGWIVPDKTNPRLITDDQFAGKF
jgi:beta-mannanase